MKCYELAPRRFGWERHEYPDIDRAGVALRDGKKAKNGAFITGDKRIGWILTPPGIDWAVEHVHAIGDGKVKGSSVLSAADDRELRQLREHRLFGEWRAGNNRVSVFQAADVVGLPADAPTGSIARRIIELESAARAGGRADVEGFLEWLKGSLSAVS